MDIEASEYVGMLAPEYGVRVSVHAPGELPDPEAEGFNVAPGQLTEVGIRFRQQMRLPEPYPSNCTLKYPKWFHDEGVLFPDRINYTLTACKMACTDYHLKRICNCVQYRFFSFRLKSTIMQINDEKYFLQA